MQIAVGGCLAQKDRDAVLQQGPVGRRGVRHPQHRVAAGAARPRPAQPARPRSRSSRRWRNSRPTLPARANPPTPHGFRSPSAATTPARSASCPRCAARRSTAGPATCWPRCSRWSTRACSRSRCSGRTSTPTGSRSPTPISRATAARSRKLLRACGRIDGLERVRFTSPHPAEFTDDVIEAMAETPNVCPTLHMPLQSGSDRMLRAMRRSYRAERYLGIIDRVRAAIPHAAITTDLIVGFPGETEEDFQATLDVVAAARFASAFTFQYSKRPGTPAAELDAQLPKAVVQERYQRLIDLQERISLEENTAQIGRTVELLVATGEGRKDASTARMSGRARDGRLVHFDPAGRRHPARRHRHHHRHRRRAASPDRRRRAAEPPAHPGRRRARGRAAARRVSASACPASARPRAAADRDRMCPVTAGDRQQRRLRRVQGRHRGRRTPRRARNRPRRKGVGHRHRRLRAAADVRAAAHRRRQGLGCAGGQRCRDRRRDLVAVAGVHLAGAGVQRRLLDAGAADQAVGAGVDRAGRIHRGVLLGPAGGVVAADRPRTRTRGPASG